MSGEVSALEEKLAEQAAQLEMLRSELDETNRGVVALYAELEDNAVQLKEAADLKSRFLSYMSHEFRTPLASITSIAGILLADTDGPLTSEQRRQVQYVQGERARAERDGRRPPRPRQGGGGTHLDLPRVVRDGGSVLSPARLPGA